MLDIQLRVFKTVVEKQSFSLAAQELHMTQSSVSQQIQNLENYYGVKLFDRLHRRIQITQAGASLYPYAVEVERLYQEAHRSMQGLIGEISGRLHIGASLTIGEYIMPAILVRFSRMYPKVDIAMDIFNTEQITAMVAAGKINLGFVEGPFHEFEALSSSPFSGDRLVVIAPPDHPLAQYQSAPLAEVLQERWVMREKNSGTRRVFEQFVASHGHDTAALNIVMELGSTQAIKEAVQSGLGIAALSCLSVLNETRHGEIAVIRLAEGDIQRVFHMLCHREKFQTRAVAKFREYVLETMAAGTTPCQ